MRRRLYYGDPKLGQVRLPTNAATNADFLKYRETPLIRTLRGLENSVLNRGVCLIERFILTEIKALVTDFTVLIRGVSC